MLEFIKDQIYQLNINQRLQSVKELFYVELYSLNLLPYDTYLIINEYMHSISLQRFNVF